VPGDAEGQGLNETNLKDLAQFRCATRFRCAGRVGAQPYGGTYRQIQIYVDPLKMEARNLSLNDVVTSVNGSNLILPAAMCASAQRLQHLANSQFPMRIR